MLHILCTYFSIYPFKMSPRSMTLVVMFIHKRSFLDFTFRLYIYSQLLLLNKFKILPGRGVTIRMPHDTIRIEIFGCDTILFDTIHICTVKSYTVYVASEQLYCECNTEIHILVQYNSVLRSSKSQ